MSEETKAPEAGTPNVEQPTGEAKPQSISIQDILNTYPIDREKCRDVVMLEISGNLRRIADSLEGLSQGMIVANTHLSDMKSK